MLPALFRREFARQLASFGGQTAAGSFFRVIGLLLRGALWLFHNQLNLPFLGSVVNSGQAFCPTSRCSRLPAALMTQKRGFHAWPMKQDATPAQPHTGNFAGHAPVEQRAAADWQFRQQLLFVNET